MEDLLVELRQFVSDRDWRVFHTPKNLAMALTVEAGELMEHFQWLTQEQSAALPDDRKAQVSDEIGDVLIYLILLADRLGIDPLAAAKAKVLKNHQKYPAEKVRGKALKYKEYS